MCALPISTVEVTIRRAFARVRAMAMASLAPLVKITWSRQPSAAALRPRAPSSAARAARPSACGDEGLAPLSAPGHIASRPFGNVGVGAAGSGSQEPDKVARLVYYATGVQFTIVHHFPPAD